jgi:intraflagellar transport protein 81
MLEQSRNYRLEIERDEKINQQKSELKTDLSQLDQKIDRLEKILKEQQSSYHDLNAESNFITQNKSNFLNNLPFNLNKTKAIVQKMEEENKVNSYMANDKYPKEIQAYKQTLKNYEMVGSKSVMSQAEVDDIKRKINEVNKELSGLIEKRDKNRDLSDDQLMMLRQQQIIIGRRKDQLAENLKDLRSEHNALDKQLKEKRKNFGEDGENLTGEEVS